jgi:glycosyltransferase involved in cell wall biosynthesis
MTDSHPIPIGFAITELDPGGAERAFTQLVTRLDRQEWSPHVYCLSGHGELGTTIESAGIPVTYLEASGRWDFGLIGRFAKALKRVQPKLLQTFLHHANIAGRFAAKRAGVSKVICGIRVAEERSRWRLRIDRWTQRYVTSNVCVSPSVAEFSEYVGGIPSEKLEVIPNGVEFDLFANATAIDWTTVGLPGNARVILVVGRLEIQKHPELALFACEPLFAENPDLHVVYAGVGSDRDMVEHFVAHKKLTTRVHLLGRRDDVPRLMKGSALLLHVSSWEGAPNVILEAVASGLPVICSDNPGNRDALRGGKWGTMIDSLDPKTFTDAIRSHLESPQHLHELALTAQQQISQDLTWGKMVTAYTELYRKHLS